MANLFDYLEWRGDLSFKQSPFCVIDALLLAQISYLKFYGLIPEEFNQSVTLPELAFNFKHTADYEYRKDLGLVINPRTAELFEMAAVSNRFKDVKVCGLKEKIDLRNSEQFGVMTFIADGFMIAAFRGTDDSIVGWKEDFNIAYLPEIPSQIHGVEYCKKAVKELKLDLILTGHSKGGNLALYCAAKSGSDVQKKLSAVYNFDGPGFYNDFFETEEFKAIEPKLTNIYPGFSIVGRILNHSKKIEIIKSLKNGVWQHDAVNWQITGTTFEHVEKFTKESDFFNNAINKWLEKMTVEDKKSFILSIFKVVEASECKSNSEIAKNLLPSSAKMIKCLASMDKKTRDGISNALSALTDIIKADIPLFNLLKK